MSVIELSATMRRKRQQLGRRSWPGPAGKLPIDIAHDCSWASAQTRVLRVAVRHLGLSVSFSPPRVIAPTRDWPRRWPAAGLNGMSRAQPQLSAGARDRNSCQRLDHGCFQGWLIDNSKRLGAYGAAAHGRSGKRVVNSIQLQADRETEMVEATGAAGAAQTHHRGRRCLQAKGVSH